MKKLSRFSAFAVVMFLVTPVAIAGGHKKDVVGTAAANEQFSTLVTAVKAAGLVETLKSKGPFTVFAPTNDAFAALPKGTVENLLKPENKNKLAAILKHHVVSGKVMASDVSGKKFSPRSSDNITQNQNSHLSADSICLYISKRSCTRKAKSSNPSPLRSRTRPSRGSNSPPFLP